MARAFTTGGCILLLSVLHAQSVPPRLHGRSQNPAAQAQPTGATQPPAPSPQGQPGATQPGTPSPQGQPGAALPPAPATPVAADVAPSMLQQPAQEAKIVFDSNRLSIHADNSSLTGILRQIASTSGMKVEGLSGDERVFGTFGPGAPRDVLADLLNGTAYNVALIGDLDNGAPRELVLTPTTHGAAAPAAAPQSNSDDAIEQEPQDVQPQPPPDVPQSPAAQTPDTPATPGVRTPQQLFEQLQRMRQGQNQGQPPVQQDSPQQ
jgi:hypothetical protein